MAAPDDVTLIIAVDNGSAGLRIVYDDHIAVNRLSVKVVPVQRIKEISIKGLTIEK